MIQFNCLRSTYVLSTRPSNSMRQGMILIVKPIDYSNNIVNTLRDIFKRYEIRWFSEKNTIFSDYFLWLWLCRFTINIVSYQYDSSNKWTLILHLGLNWREKRPWTRRSRNWLVIFKISYFILLILSNIGLYFCKILRNEKISKIPWFNVGYEKSWFSVKKSHIFGPKSFRSPEFRTF